MSIFSSAISASLRGDGPEEGPIVTERHEGGKYRPPSMLTHVELLWPVGHFEACELAHACHCPVAMIVGGDRGHDAWSIATPLEEPAEVVGNLRDDVRLAPQLAKSLESQVSLFRPHLLE